MNKIKIFALFLTFSLLGFVSYGQKTFIGVAKYRMAVVGGPDEDSSTIVFDKNRILQTLYLSDAKNPKKINEVNIINDFSAKRQYTLNKINKTYKADTLINTRQYNFIDTSNIKCYHKHNSKGIEGSA